MKPVLQALILADRIYEDRTTRKKVIAGTFNQFMFSKSGGKQDVVEGAATRRLVAGGMLTGSPYAYVSLTELRGEIQCVLRYVALAEDRVLFQTEFTLECGDPLETLELVLPLPPLPHSAGVHALELLCNDEPLGSLRVLVKDLDSERQSDDDS